MMLCDGPIAESIYEIYKGDFYFGLVSGVTEGGMIRCIPAEDFVACCTPHTVPVVTG